MALKASFTTIRYYTAADPYHYTIDNRPLTDLKAGLDFLADTMDAGFTTTTLTTTTVATGSTTALSITTTGGTQFQVTHTVGANRNVTITGSNAGNPVIGTTAGNLNLTSAQILHADGGVGTPSLAFAADATSGIYRIGASNVGVTLGGTLRYSFATSGNGFGVLNTHPISWGATLSAPDLFIWWDAANILAQRNGTTAQAVRTYNTFTDASNYERLSANWSSNVVSIVAEQAGTGTAREMQIGTTGNSSISFRSNNVNRWFVENTTGHLKAVADGTYDLGATAATRPRSGYFTGRLIDGQITVTYSASMTIDAALGNDYVITATNGTAFTINAPTNPITGQFISVLIRNTFGTLGVATWNAAFKMTAWTQPLNGFSRCIYFAYDGTNWVERGRTSADVPN